MKRTLALLLLTSAPAWAQDPGAALPAPPRDGLAPVDRAEPGREQKLLEKGTAAQRSRVIARAAARSQDSDEAVTLLAYAAERARPLELRASDLVIVARGLAARGRTKLARTGLFALLSTPPREGVDGQSLHQQIAATALARVADVADPPAERPAKPEDAKPAIDTLQRLLELAEEARLEATVTQALLRYPPRRAPHTVTGPASFRIGARLGDLRWVGLIERALNPRERDQALQIAALAAAAELGDSRVLPRVRSLARHPSGALAVAALRAWAALEPTAGTAAIERALAGSGAPMPYLALAQHVSDPELLGRVAARLGNSDASTLPEAVPLLSTLPRGSGVATLAKLAAQDTTVHAAVRALTATRHATANAALAHLLERDPRPVARHEAAYALLTRALEPSDFAAEARSILRRTSTPLPIAIAHWLDGNDTPRTRAARALYVAAARGGRPRAALAECARALRVESPGCAYAFGRSAPRALDDATRELLSSLLEIADPSIRAELLEGLLASEWPGRFVELARALEETHDLALRRRLARRAVQLAHERDDARAALAPALLRLESAEPDLQTARLLRGHTDARTARTALLRADADGQVRCGYLRDELGNVSPFVLEDGGAVIADVVGPSVEATFTRCDDGLGGPPKRP